MNNGELVALVDRLRCEPDEIEWLEFKRNRYQPQELGMYLSALANGACLVGKPRGYLLFGIDDESHEVVGTSFNPYTTKGKGNQDLLPWLGAGLRPNIGYDVYSVDHPEGRVVLFEVGAAWDRPVSFYGKAYIRVGSSKTELSKYPEKERAIWLRRTDWSALVSECADLTDLDPEALLKAREQFTVKHPAQAKSVDTWDEVTFLNKAKLTIHGGITHAAILLLGKPEASGLLSSAVARISWILKDAKNLGLDYEHFGPPFILQVDRVLRRIRNLTLRALPSGTLFPQEIGQYDPWVIREALHNCIAHQDYGLHGRISVVETPSSVLLTNAGTFLPGTVENVIRQDAPMEIYRNPFLAEVMVNLNMIDTQGGGIKKMFVTQAGRFFPMPDYDLSEADRVAVTIRGTILDERYSRLLMERSDLDLDVIMLLDRVQKGVRIEHDDAARLRRMGLVEGRYPNLIVSGRIAAKTDGQADHIRKRGFKNQYYQDLLLSLIREHGPVGPDVINELLIDKLPDALSEKQKKAKIRNLTYDLAHRRNLIVNVGSPRGPGARWALKDGSLTKNDGNE